jgi:hypothetical protein
VSFFLRGISDARHLLRTLIAISEFEKPSFTIVNINKCAIVRDLIVFMLLGKLSDLDMIPRATIIFYKLCSVAILGHLELLLLENYILIVALTPDLQRVSFYSVTEFPHHSSTTKLILS